MSLSQEPTPLRVGVVGLGFAGSTHLAAYQKIPGVEVVALAGLETERLHALADSHGVEHRYERWEDLVARDDLDIVSVGTPTYLHEPVTVAALASGAHVLCEKPLARTAEEGKRMVDAAVAAGRVLHIAFNHRRRGDVDVLKHQIDAGALGRIYYAKAHWRRRNGIPGMGSWFTDAEMAGGGPLIDLGVHMLDMALFLLGEPRVLSVSASTFAELGPRGLGGRVDVGKTQVAAAYGVEDLATAFLRLEGGATLLLETSWASYRRPGDNFGVELFGSDGGAMVDVEDYTHSDTLRIYTDVAGVPAEVRPAVTKGEGHLAVVREFIDAVRGGDWSAHVGRDALTRARIIDACYRSALEGREVAVEAD
jgi:predicted dehydrogenase